MVEWYEAYADYRDTMARIEELIAPVAQEATGTTRATFRGHEVDLASWQPRRSSSTRSRSTASGRATPTSSGRVSSSVRSTRRRTGPGPSSSTTRSRAFVEPSLIEPTILHDYPIELSPFARTTDDDPTTVERFEFFVGGMELGNASREINDPDEQAERFAMQEDRARRRRPDCRARRPRLRRGALLRDAADGRSRPRDRPSRDRADRARHDPRRGSVPGVAPAL